MGIDGKGGTQNYDFACALNREWRIRMLVEAKAEEKERCWQIWQFKGNGHDSDAPLEALND